jgi:hypothetical protein
MPVRLLVLIAAASLLPGAVTSAKQTDWWRTRGAAVVEHDVAGGEPACSLVLYDQEQAAIVTWEADDRKSVAFDDTRWHLPAHQPVQIAVQIGDTWLGNPPDPGKPNLTASANQQLVSVTVQQPIEGVLHNATQITATMPDRGLSVNVNHGKMPRLLAAVHRCRGALASAWRGSPPAGAGAEPPYHRTPNSAGNRH